ncbi:MAG TPA: SRPBCC family protein [Rhizobiaceae bacterium]|nr:SRPBCC family protein [Rhizobiaceae bacterium]
MSKTVSPAPVRRSVTVNVPQDKAFEVFTSGLSRWWPSTHSIGSSPLNMATMEPRVGGRWYETGEDGNECEWGEVLAWEPPSRVLLAWRINTAWKFDPSIHTEVEIRFVPLAQGGTRVELEHRLLENLGEQAQLARESFDSEGGWPGLLSMFAAAAEEAA